MGFLRTLILVTSAVGMLAVLNAGPAHADETMLCMEALVEEDTCPSEYYPEETEVLAVSGNVTFSGLLGDTECESTLAMTTSMEGGEPLLEADVTSVSFTGCTRVGGGECTIESIDLPYQASVLADEEDPGNGDLFIYGAESPPGVTLSSCGPASGCTFTVNSFDEEIGGGETKLAKLRVDGGAEATLTADDVEVNGGICGSATWSGVYVIANPAPLFVLQVQRTKLCEKSKINPCEERYGPGTILKAVIPAFSKATIEYKFGGVTKSFTCSAGSFGGIVGRSKGFELQGVFSSFGFGSSGTCDGGCWIFPDKLPWGLKFLATGAIGDGVMSIGNAPTFLMGCEKHGCAYRGGSLNGVITGGVNASWALVGSLGEVLAGDKACEPPLKISSKFEFSEPEAEGKPQMWLSKF